MMDIPLWEKALLTLEEAAALTGVGINKLRILSDSKDCDFVVWNGRKRLLKRTKLITYLEECYSI